MGFTGPAPWFTAQLGMSSSRPVQQRLAQAGSFALPRNRDRAMYNLEYLEGRRFCVVFVKVLDHASGRVQCRCLRGRAHLEEGHLHLMSPQGSIFTVPASALPTVAPNDGTGLLKDAEFYCMVKVGDNIRLFDDPGDHRDDGGCDCGGCGPIIS